MFSTLQETSRRYFEDKASFNHSILLGLTAPRQIITVFYFPAHVSLLFCELSKLFEVINIIEETQKFAAQCVLVSFWCYSVGFTLAIHGFW